MKMSINKHNIFLFDGLGALLSMLLLGIVLPALQPFIGIPHHVLYGLALVPVVFSAYSFFCFFRIELSHHTKHWLHGIILGNSLYCVTTLSVLFSHFEVITWWGSLYFAVEFLVMLVLIGVEINIAYQQTCCESPPNGACSKRPS